MKAETLRQIKNIDDSLKWIKKNRPEHYDQRFLELVGQRRRLRRIANALHEKPAIAAYGESQKGKSYLIGNLLQKQKSPFFVKNEKGEPINFVARVNPIGDNKEATGVVTRFTPFNDKDNTGRYHADHPVIVKLLSVANIATVFCDSYFNDLMDKQFYPDDEIREVASRIYEQYRTMPEQTQTVLTEDDILDIKAYLQHYVKDAQVILRSGYLDKLALVIRRVPQSEWASVLKYLWHENNSITALFNRLVGAMSRLDFQPEVYVDFDAVMHLGDNRNTIMSVDCLNGLDDTAWSLTCNVYVPEKNGGMKCVGNFPKCELCALCVETIFKIEPEYLEDRDSFFYDPAHPDDPGYLPAESKSKLPDTVKKDLLADTDLLDFPGARSRLKVQEQFLDIFDTKAGASNMVQMLLRGKVAFLFNHYSESRIINILLFCHDNVNVAVNEMYMMINDWVEKYVGKDPQARSKTVERCGGVAPLFVVGTKFNIDMMEKHDDDGDNENGCNTRWSGRFMKVLYTTSFKADNVQWFNNWDSQGSSFKNTYMLRDFKYSGCDGKGNNIYEGYDSRDSNPMEHSLKLTTAFYNRLRHTFITNEDVCKFFADPAKAWDAAATLNNDGSLYIISQLAIVARNMGVNRIKQFDLELGEIRNKVSAIMKDYYVSDDTTEILAENIRKARGIFREVEFACQNTPEYFGHLLQALQLSEAECFKEVHRLIPMLNDIINQPNARIKDYELIRKRCRNFEGCRNEAEKWDRLIECYYFANQNEASEFLSAKGIDPGELFRGENIKRKNSAVIASMLIELWENNIRSVEFTNRYADEASVDEVVISNLTTCVLNTARNVGLAERIEAMISDHVDMLNTLAINENLVADIIATAISDFVTDFGYTMLSEEQVEAARRVARSNKINCFDWNSRERKETYDTNEMTELFNEILSSAQNFTPAYEANYNRWLEFMFVAFIAHINVPDYDKDANDRLAAVLASIGNQPKPQE